MGRRKSSSGFSVLEVLISLAIIAVLVGLLVPCLIFARDSARRTLCAGNLRQIGNGWHLYLYDWDRFPAYPENPEWKYGGAVFRANDQMPILASDRPINRYIAEEETGHDSAVALFRCPSDGGIFPHQRGARPARPASILERGTCFDTFGSSYRANSLLLDARLTGIESGEARPLRWSEVAAASHRLLVLGDPEWHYATRSPGDPDVVLDASWHTVPAAGNVLALDNSIKFYRLAPEDIGPGGRLTLHPRR
jgi:prepilin-type N-terminal cleavage/methylation domain-containing protein